MVKKLKYGGRNVKIAENIDFRLIWQFQEVIGQKLHSKEKYCHWLFWSKYGSQHIDILLLQFSGNFQKITLVNIFSVCDAQKCPSVTLFVSLPLKNFKTIFKFCVSGIQAIYLTYMWPENLAWKALEYIKWFR